MTWNSYISVGNIIIIIILYRYIQVNNVALLLLSFIFLDSASAAFAEAIGGLYFSFPF
jgi:hypothetical protein